MIKVGIVGYGFSGAFFHAPILKDLEVFEISAVVSTRPETVKQDLPNAVVYPDLDQMLANSSVDLCIVATANDSHFEIAHKCLVAGCHVVVEKPFVLEVEHGITLEKLANKKNRMLAVYHCRRWDGDFLTIKRLVDTGAIGKPHSFFSHYERWRPEVKDRWRERAVPGAGILWDLGAHLIDQALMLLGPAKAVTGHIANRRPGAQATDHFHLMLEHESAISYLHGDNRTLTPGPRFQLHGEHGSFIKFRGDGIETFLLQKKGPKTVGWGVDAKETWGELTTLPEAKTETGPKSEIIETERGCHEAFYEAMARAILQNGPVPVTARQATDVVSIIQATERSSEEGRRILL